jgi:outer membrane protein OmpA-like peptidoglycan-associated protein
MACDIFGGRLDPNQRVPRIKAMMSKNCVFFVRWSLNIAGWIAVLMGGLFVSGTAAAQTTVYTDSYGNPTVTVDLSVLEQFGTRPNYPKYLRPSPYSSETGAMTERGPGGLLRPPPRRMPKSKLTLPKGGFQRKSAGRNLPPPPRSSVKPPPRRLAPPKSVAVRPVSVPPAAKVGGPTSKARRAVPLPPTLSAPAPIPSRRTARGAVSAPRPLRPPSAIKPKSSVKKLAPVAPPARLPVRKSPKTAPKAVSKAIPKPIAPPKARPVPKAPKVASRAAPPPAPSRESAAPAEAISISPDGNLYRIPFAAKVTTLPGGANAALARLSDRMKKNEDLRIQLMGYAGGGSSASQNRRTSLFRALAIRTHLMKQGIRSTRMVVQALGDRAGDGAKNRVDVVVQQ